MDKLLLVDGSSLIHRAFHALPPLRTSQGLYVNAVYGMETMLRKIMGKIKPDYAVICFDKSRITFRNEIDAEYKATRKPTPPELKGQFSLAKELLDAQGISWLEADGYEADDLIGTLAKEGARKGFSVAVFTGDRDILQLIDDNVTVYMTKRGITDTDEWTPAFFREQYGLEPQQLIELKALMGDSSDNIKGVAGVGEKTALKLITSFGTVDALYQRLEEVENEKLRIKLQENKDSAVTSHTLATICTAVPIGIDWDSYKAADIDDEILLAVYRKLEFRSLLSPLEKKVAKKQRTIQPNLFDFAAAPENISSPQAELAAEFNTEEIKTAIRAAGCFALYMEWTEAPQNGDITAVGIAANDKSWGTSIAGSMEKYKLLPLAELFADPQIKKLTLCSKEQTELLYEWGIPLKGVTGDLTLAGYLLNPSEGDYTAALLLGGESAHSALEMRAADYAAKILLCSVKINAELAQQGMTELYQETELPLSAVLCDMEITGINVKREKLLEISQMLEGSINLLTKEIYALAGTEFNINSPKQMGEILFEKMHLPGAKKTKTGYSTNADILEQLADNYEIAAKILAYRTDSKLKSTYADGLRNLIDPRTNRLHTTFNQTVTATGRLSSTEPNLQNIPARTEMGRKLRQAFVPQEGNILLAADYNQIELRVLAHISEDEKFIEAFRNGEDIHTRTAAEIFGVTAAEITPELRRKAKAVNFGIVYGISDFGLARELNINRTEAKHYIDSYFERYPKIHSYQAALIKQGKADGYVTTLFGRRRYLPELNNSNFNIRSFAERMAINTPIQGSAADIMKIAMVRLYEQMNSKGLHSKMLLQVHDELVFDMIPEEVGILTALVKSVMEDAAKLSVPLLVDMKSGNDWCDMKKIQ